MNKTLTEIVSELIMVFRTLNKKELTKERKI